ncbi:MAG TPA: ribonuclease HI [Candidatus Limiplasma sp.]|nr:ribonuclease HI [Candidatus Limiplasma sp.]HPS81133.1 ribonuclease HI [Candidatus Limiplasma sp.]
MTQPEQTLAKRVQLYTDGACSGNPGPGGWAAILSFNGKTKELSGHMPNTTNNRMELFAVISGIGALKEPCAVEVFSDSAYTVNAFNEHWIDNWQKNGWLNSEKKPVENSDLWKLLLQIIRVKKHQVTFNKVKGHANDPQNIRCDELARAAIKEYRRINGEETEDAPAAKPETPTKPS